MRTVKTRAKTMRLPSVKTLTKAFPDMSREDAKILRNILRDDKRPIDYPERFPSTLSWERQCHHPPRQYEVAMNAANEIIGGYGVEAVFSENVYWPWLEYVNQGDPYIPTLCRIDGRYRVACPGDILERDKRQKYLVQW